MVIGIKPEFNSLDTIIFDFGGVLLDLDVSRTYEALQLLLGFEGDPYSIYEENKDLFDSFETGHTIVENFLWNLQHRSQKVPPVDKVISAWNAMLLGWNPIKLQLLNSLQHKYRLFLLSNTNEIHINWVHRDLHCNHGIVDFENKFFEKVYYSHKLGMRKPNADIFEFVINDAGINPSRALFIDDNAHNIEVARKIGFQTQLHVTNGELNIF